MDLLAQLDPADPQYATAVVDRLLAAGRTSAASDIHLLPGEEGLELRFRIDGVLRPVAVVPRAVAANVIARLKVQAELLTYRTDMPQEGRIRTAEGNGQAAVEMRVSTFPPSTANGRWCGCSAAAANWNASTTWVCRPTCSPCSRRSWAKRPGRFWFPARPAAARPRLSTPACGNC